MNLPRRIIPPVYFLAALLLMLGLHYLLPLTEWIREFIRYAGITLIVLGVAIAAWGSRAFDKAGTPVKPFETTTMLVTHGLYRFTRNPMYLGMVLVLLGTGFLLGSLTPLLVMAAGFMAYFVLVLLWRIKAEVLAWRIRSLRLLQAQGARPQGPQAQGSGL